jgi:enolase-phosphatase E1
VINSILIDIEGTTSSISFVHEVLFPYAAKHLAKFVHQHANEEEIQRQLQATRDIVGQADLDQQQTIDILLEWIQQDKKLTPLKALQGLIWEIGYTRGDYKSHLYPDVLPQLQAWHEAGKKLYIYSSGSIKAQQLFFAHTEYGNITHLLSGYFDTTSGAKQEPTSYTKIATAIAVPTAQILFLSDITAELDAASSTGMATCCLNRQAERISTYPHVQVQSFATINLDNF